MCFFLLHPTAMRFLASIYKELYNIEQRLGKKEFSAEVFSLLAQVSCLAECAYAANTITRNYRQYLIRKLGKLYVQFAENIASHPPTHLQIVKKLIGIGIRNSATIPSIFDVVEQPLFNNHFSIVPRLTERKIHENLVPQSLIEFFRSEEVGVQPNQLPQFLLKQQMFYRAISDDLARSVEALAQPTKQILTLTGSVAERIARMGILLDFLENGGISQIAGVNYDILKSQLRYLAVEWQYRSVKIYPQLEGSLSAIAMQQQGYEESLFERVKAFHLAGTKQQKYSHEPETNLLILVGKLDEAVSLFARSVENGRSIGKFDPFGVKTKIAVATDAAKRLAFDLNDLRKLLAKIIMVNPDATGDEAALLYGYFWARIEKGFSLDYQYRISTTSKAA